MAERWIIQTGFLGDCVLTLPLLSRLAGLYPKDRIHVITSAAGKDIFELSLKRGLKNAVSRIEIHSLSKNERGLKTLWSFVHKLPRPDVVFCVHRSFRTGFLAYLSRAKERIGFSTGAASFFYTKLVKRDWDNGRHEIEKNLDLLRSHQEAEALEPSPPWAPESASPLLAAESRAEKKIESVVLSLSSPWATKRWPLRHATELLEKLLEDPLFTKKIILVGDKGAQVLSEKISKKVQNERVQDLTGRTTIEEWVDIIAGAAFVLSGDSAAVHVASDLNIPVLALFGPTLPEFGFAPWRRGSLALGVQNLSCRPCNIHGPKTCPMGHHRCLEDLSADLVLRYFERYNSSTL